MKNIKKLLSAISALGLVTTVAVTVTACSSDNRFSTLPVGVTNILGLTDGNGNPKITPSLKINSSTFKYSWTSSLPQITGKSFVTDKLIAKNEDCSSLLKTTFQLSPNTKGAYDDNELDKITATITYFPTFSKNISNNDFYVSGGTIQIQFVKDKKNIDNIYSVALKSGVNNNQLINSQITFNLMTINDFDTSAKPADSTDSNPLFNGDKGFKVGQDISIIVGKTCKLLPSNNEKATDNDKKIASLNKILTTELTIKVEYQTQNSGQWTSQDWVKLSYTFKIGNLTIKIATESTISPSSA